jgi:hypothetical protein
MRSVSRLSLFVLCVCLLALVQASAGLAAGQTLYVKTSGSDTAACTATAPCRTIKHAVAVAGSGDTISVGSGTFSEDYGVSVDKDLTITGLGWYSTRVELGFYNSLGGGCFPVFQIEDGATVALAKMTISRGISGGQGCAAGGIYNRGALTLTSVRVADNLAPGVENASWASLAMTNVSIEHNLGGGLLNWGTATLDDSRITDSYGSYPAGVRNGGTLVVNRGLFARNAGPGLEVNIDDCGTTTLVNVTISGNHGGVDVSCGALTLKHVTIAANDNGGDRGSGLSAAFHSAADYVNVLNSIIATNSGKQCQLYAVAPAIVSIGVSGSLIGDNSCLAWPAPANLIGVDPKLAPLSYGCVLVCAAFHLGATRVHKLLPGSPAIDSAEEQFCVPTDQLGTPRPQDGDGNGIPGCDMGAYEYKPPGGTTDTR